MYYKNDKQYLEQPFFGHIVKMYKISLIFFLYFYNVNIVILSYSSYHIVKFTAIWSGVQIMKADVTVRGVMD